MDIKNFKKLVIAILPHGLVVLHRRGGVIKAIRSFFYFSKNQKRVNTVASLLADKWSKEVYLAVIQSRYMAFELEEYITWNCIYFDNVFFTYSENEFLLDCGGYTGDSIDAFISFVPNYKGIISFEPMPGNFEIIKRKHGTNPKIRLENKGIWDGGDGVTFLLNGASSKIIIPGRKDNEKDNVIEIDVTSIDSLNLQEKVTFIKMDIEGAELNALKGASQTILRDKPKLAISIYHSNEDMIEIVEYINKLCPEYKLYVRYYLATIYDSDTVLYGCP